MQQSEEYTGRVSEWRVKRLVTRGIVTDEFHLTLTVEDATGQLLTGVATVTRQEEERLHNYFIDIRRITVETEGPIMIIVLDPDVEPMPAFRLLPGQKLAQTA